MSKMKRHVEDRHGITKMGASPGRSGQQNGRSRTSGKTDFDERQVSKNQGHGHPREERRSSRL